jgi:5-methylcytosine-specific restriction endonuclease McrA
VKSLLAELTTGQWVRALNYFGNRCAYCGAESEVLHQEHFIPCVAGGGLTVTNIVPACPKCNLSKKDAVPTEWATGRGASRIMPDALDKINRYFAEMALCV